MDQGEWLTSADPFHMLRLLHPRPVSPRKYRLFGAACCRRAWLAGAGARCDAAAAALERFADTRPEGLDRVALAGAWGVGRVASRAVERLELAARFVYAAVQPPNAWWTAHWSAEAWLDWAGATRAGAAKQEAAVVAHLLRDLIGSPTASPKTLPPHVTAWNDGTVKRIAEGVYDDRRLPEGTLDPGRLAILADALLNAGLEEDGLLEHLRSPGPHVRGCHAVDLILGRQ